MITYVCDEVAGNKLIRIQKDYRLELCSQQNRNFVIKRMTAYSSDQIKLNKTYKLGYLTPETVENQLSNIRHIGFEVTDACNLKCTYCTYGKFYTDYDIRSDKKIDVRKAIVLLDFLVGKIRSYANYSYRNEVLITFYGGEPLMNINFIKQIVAYVQCYGDESVNFRFGITTNGIYLKKYIEYLMDNKFLITVSLDGARKHDKHRKYKNGKSSYDAVYYNLKFIQQKYNAYFIENIRFNSVIHNLNNKEEIFDYFQNEFDKIPRFSLLTPAGVNPRLKQQFEDLRKPKPFTGDTCIYDQMRIKMDLNYDDFSVLQDFIFHFSGNTFYSYNDLLARKTYSTLLPSATCIPFSRRIFMTVNNKILPCERIGQQYSLGVVTDSHVDLDCKDIADRYNKMYDSIQQQYENCY